MNTNYFFVIWLLLSPNKCMLLITVERILSLSLSLWTQLPLMETQYLLGHKGVPSTLRSQYIQSCCLWPSALCSRRSYCGWFLWSPFHNREHEPSFLLFIFPPHLLTLVYWPTVGATDLPSLSLVTVPGTYTLSLDEEVKDKTCLKIYVAIEKSKLSPFLKVLHISSLSSRWNRSP